MERQRQATAWIRVYGELNDFLSPERRRRTIPIRFDVPPTVKDAVEGIGVPHVEIDAVVRNRRFARLDDRLTAGDRIAAYPCFRRVHLPDEVRIGPPPPAVWRFAVDVHLRRLARRLRILGIDVWLRDGAEDAEMVRVCCKEDRVLLTRDRALLRHGALVRGYWVRATDPAQQLPEVLRRFDLFENASPFTRCPRCNGRLVPVDKGDVLDRIPPRTAAWLDDYMICPACGQLYWRGTHHDRLTRQIERLFGADRTDSPM